MLNITNHQGDANQKHHEKRSCKKHGTNEKRIIPSEAGGKGEEGRGREEGKNKGQTLYSFLYSLKKKITRFKKRKKIERHY